MPGLALGGKHMENMQKTNKYKGDDFILWLFEQIAVGLIIDGAKWLIVHGPEILSALLS